MKLFFQGGHLPTYRNVLKENNVKDISLSYFGLRQRTKFTKGWDISKYFDSQNVFVDSGCYTINSAKEQKYTDDELREIAAHYYAWVADNISAIQYYTEFDATQLGDQFLEDHRDSLRDIAFDKFIPIWHANKGLDNLLGLGETYGRVGILQTAIGGRDLVPYLNRLAKSGIKLHGLSMTKPDIMEAIPWESVSSTSWISPMQYGDTIVWSHGKLKRYPKSMKNQARKKERVVLRTAGFDTDKIDRDDSRELLKVSLWSWSQQVDAINKKHRVGVTAPVEMDDGDFTDFSYTEVGDVVEKTQNRVPTARPRNPEDRRIVPFIEFSYDTEKRRNPTTNEMEDVEVPKINVRSESMRICDTCFLASKCPMFEENATCAYDMPIQVETKEQLQALANSTISLQTQRVLFMKMAEDAEGGYADPNLSSELDRLTKMIKNKHEMEQEGFSLTVTAKQQGQMSMVDRIFGDLGNTKPLHQLEAAVDTQDAMTQLGIIDAEIEY